MKQNQTQTRVVLTLIAGSLGGALAILNACSTVHRTPAAAETSGLTFDWKLVKHPELGMTYWQAIGLKGLGSGSVEAIESPEERKAEINRRVAEVDAREANGQGCPAGMVRVQGAMKDWTVVFGMQKKTAACLKFDNANWDPEKDKCYQFDIKQLQIPADVATAEMSFCIDRFEFPNIPNENPAVMVTWQDARKACTSQGKRLCSENEWTFACEGERALPYPYGDGVTRDKVTCNVDSENKQAPTPTHNMKIGSASDLAAAAKELDVLWRGLPSGIKTDCRSPFGVYDLTGNVDEWTMHSPGRPWEARKRAVSGLVVDEDPQMIHSILKGGWWGPIRGRCQPSTTTHDESFQNYEIGFRCCANAAQ